MKPFVGLIFKCLKSLVFLLDPELRVVFAKKTAPTGPPLPLGVAVID
jgi:hypothetical protein